MNMTTAIEFLITLDVLKAEIEAEELSRVSSLLN
jgi:hypothetical protein